MKRRDLKNQAKAALKDNFGSKMLLFIIPIILGIFSGGNQVHTVLTDNNNINFSADAGGASVSHLALLIAGPIIAVTVLITIAISLFIIVITTGAIFNYIKIFRGERSNPQFKNIFAPFSDGSLWKIVLLNVVIGLVMIVLILIPIIGWAFAVYLGLGWSQSTYVLFDQLEEGRYAGVKQVLRESSAKMKGLRGNYFIYKLSFFWWYILNGISGGLAGFWTMPYFNMADIAYYENIENL